MMRKLPGKSQKPIRCGNSVVSQYPCQYIRHEYDKDQTVYVNREVIRQNDWKIYCKSRQIQPHKN